MKLNNHSYVHVDIRKKCSQLELIIGMKLITDLNEEFVEIRYMNEIGYVVIDFRRNAVYSLSHKITPVELKLIKDVIADCNWLELGDKFNTIISEARKKGRN